MCPTTLLVVTLANVQDTATSGDWGIRFQLQFLFPK